MLDIKLLRKDLSSVQEQLLKRGFKLDVSRFNELESQRKETQSLAQELQAQRNKYSKAIGVAKGKGEDATELLTSMTNVKAQLEKAEEKSQYYQHAINEMMLELPNLLDSSVSEGNDESDNQEIEKWGELPSFDFEPKDHIELGELLNGIDTDAAVKLTGSRFVVMSGSVAKLQRALIQFMLDTHTQQHGYEEMYVPYIVNSASLTGTGQLPKFSEDLFKLENTDYHLIPTSEVPLTNLVRDKLLSEKELPLKFVTHTPCFRSEAGSYGRDTRGLIRQHQFEKVELVQIVAADKSWQALEELTNHAESILRALELPYRKMSLCSGDTGFSSAKTYDLEVWLPSQKCYREISSCSNMLDFQARRMKARYKPNDGKGKPDLVHTLNGSGLAAGRALIAVMENYQQADGSVLIPDVLKPYFGNQESIKAG